MTITIIPKQEFIDRFVAHMVKQVGKPTFDDGYPIKEIAEESAKSYWAEQHHQDGASPEECADDELYYGAQDAG